MFTHVRLASIVLSSLVACANTSHAVGAENAVSEWNQIALTATVTATQGAVPQLRSMTMVQVAMHDAVNLITRKYEPYRAHGRVRRGASPEAAAIAAAHRTLSALFPAQSAVFDAARTASLLARGLTESNPGYVLGTEVAASLLAERANDGAALAQFAYVAPGSGTPGVWTAIGTAPALLPGWGKVTPWVMQSGSQFQPDGPPSLASGRWARDYNEVKEIGAADSATRTPEQTEIARFWLGSPAVIWNGVARRLIEARSLDVSDSAYTLALMYLAGSDAAIACWDAKYTFNFWRPQHAIRSGHLDGNDRTVADDGWTPLFPTPPHPDYLSGHTTNSGAIAMALALLFGDNPGLPIVAVSPTNPGFTRTWTKFSEGVKEVIEARIYSGIHYRTSDQAGAHVGKKVARYVFRNALRRR
jgi:hypothetical protein